MSKIQSATVARRVVGGLLVSAAALIWAFGSVAAAAPGDSGDPRATAFPGNTVTCAGAGLSGQILIGSGGSGGASNQFITVVSDGTYLDVTVQPGVTVTGAVVKGGPNYNVYPGGLFVDGTENDLHAPLVGNDNVPTISHWFICGTLGTPSTPPTTTSTTTTTATTTTSTSSTGTTSGPGTSATATTTTTEAPELAVTGAPIGGISLIAFGLLVAGAILLIAPSHMMRAPKH